VDELVSPSFVAHDGPVPDGGPAFFKGAASVLGEAFTGMHFDVVDVFGSGDRVAARWRMTGRHTGELRGMAPTGKAVEQEGIVIFRTDEHGFAELWANVRPVA
jgi:predicted ester cyclase